MLFFRHIIITKDNHDEELNEFLQILIVPIIKAYHKIIDIMYGEYIKWYIRTKDSLIDCEREIIEDILKQPVMRKQYDILMQQSLCERPLTLSADVLGGEICSY